MDRLAKPLDGMAGGRVYTGAQALELGLVDKMGGLQEALRYAALEANLGEEYDVQILPKPKNLIMISIDTLRAGHLGSYGYSRPTSPRLDELAGRGTVFRNAISSSSWTVPAHMTLFTGLEPPAHGLVDFPVAGRLSTDQKTLARVLREAGLRTAAFTGGGFISERFGFADGFEVFTCRPLAAKELRQSQ